VTEAASSARAQLERWRASGADRADPLRFGFIDALERRAAAHRGEARALLDTRIAALLQDYARTLDALPAREAAVPAHAATPVVAQHDTPHALRALLDRLAAAREQAPGSDPTEPPLLDYFREVWSSVSARTQLRDALDQVPSQAGPLNSSSLVHRSLTLMRTMSPGYLKQFLAYVDALSWLEALDARTGARSAGGPRAGGRGRGR
jgi:hypothetical protein